MCLPALRALKGNFPGDDIYLVVKHHLKDIFQSLEEIKETITIPDTIGFKNTFKIAKKLKKYHFEGGILFTNSFHSALLFKLSNIKNLTGYSKDLRGFLLNNKIKFPTNNDSDSNRNRHHIYFYMDLVDFFLKETTGGKIKKKYSDELIIPEEEKENMRPLLAELGINVSKRLIGISPSAAYGSAKQWLPERFWELIKRIRKEIADCEFLLFGSSNEREKISKIIETNTIDHKDGRTHNLAGRLSLRESITAISFCDVFISNDSGLMHAASSLRVPLVAIFGPTQPQQTAPLKEENKNIKILYHPVQCAPCLYRDCPLDHRCMKAISVDEVFDALVSLLSPSTFNLNRFSK
jgi:heptosyltransferase-2